MFTKLLQHLSGRADEALAPPDIRLALAALMVRIARSDDHYEAREQDIIDTVMAHRFEIGLEAARTLREEAEALEAQAPDTVRFTRVIKQSISYDERHGIIEALWQVALADGARDIHENALMRQSAHLLGISDRDSAIARKKVKPEP